MVDNQIDLRWWLLSNLASIQSLSIIYRISVIVTFIIFVSGSSLLGMIRSGGLYHPDGATRATRNVGTIATVARTASC